MPVLPGDPRIRRSGIGGSDIAAIAGQSQWATAMDVWLEKLGQSAPLIETERMRWGTLLEDAVAREYAHKTHRKVRNAPTTNDPVTGLRARVVRYSADKPWRMAHVDRLTSEHPMHRAERSRHEDWSNEPRRGLECKTADRRSGADFGEEGTDQVPANYLIQCAWYMGVTGYDVWDLAVLIGGNTHRIYTIPRDDELIEKLWFVGDLFWADNVLGKVPPPIDGSEASRRFLEGTKAVRAEPMDMTDELYGLALSHENLKRTIEEAKVAQDLVKNQIREAMPGKGRARRDLATINWIAVKGGRLDAKALEKAEPAMAARFTKEYEEFRLLVNVNEDK